MNCRTAPERHGKRRKGRLFASSITMENDRSSSSSEAWSRICFAPEVNSSTRERSTSMCRSTLRSPEERRTRYGLNERWAMPAFVPENPRIWRWVTNRAVGTPAVKIELLADLHTQPAETTISFDACENLGALNLRGTGFATRDIEARAVRIRNGNVAHNFEVNVSGLAGFLLAKTAAAFARRKAKDWYDIAFVLLHNDAGGTAAAVERVERRFRGEIGAHQTALADLEANFEHETTQGPRACVSQMQMDHPELDPQALAADAIVAVGQFCQRLRHRAD